MITVETLTPPADTNRATEDTLSQWQLIRRRFIRHRPAVVALCLLAVLYTLAVAAEFFAPYSATWRDFDFIHCPPQPPKFSMARGLHVDRIERQIDPVTLRTYYTRLPGEFVPLGFFVKGESYHWFGLIESDRHFFGVDRSRIDADQVGKSDSAVVFYLLGADLYGHDILSRLIYGARISLSIGLVAIAVSFVLGLAIGGVSGYVGGTVDNLIQRFIEIVNSFPNLPLWLALGAAMPPQWSPLKTYFAITIVLSLLGWTGLARVVRGKILALREEDYAVAARLMGASHTRIVCLHLLPGFTSHIIVSLTLSVPTMILGETALSFLGLGLRPPIVSWGVMLQDCLSLQTIANYPWLLMPVVMVVVTVLAFNFCGDGMRDAADPYS